MEVGRSHILVGKVMVMVPVPIIDHYDVYEVRDDHSSETFLIAHARGEDKLPTDKIVVAGVLKELKANEEEEVGTGKFLEVEYFVS